MRHLVVIALLLTSCASIPQDAAIVQAAQVRAAVGNRHGFEVKTHDDRYGVSTKPDVWRAINGINRSPRGEIQDCDDDALDAILNLRVNAYNAGQRVSPAAFMLPAKMKDGRRHAVLLVLCETKSGAEWAYFDASLRREISRFDIDHLID